MPLFEKQQRSCLNRCFRERLRKTVKVSSAILYIIHRKLSKITQRVEKCKIWDTPNRDRYRRKYGNLFELLNYWKSDWAYNKKCLFLNTHVIVIRLIEPPPLRALTRISRLLGGKYLYDSYWWNIWGSWKLQWYLRNKWWGLLLCFPPKYSK